MKLLLLFPALCLTVGCTNLADYSGYESYSGETYVPVYSNCPQLPYVSAPSGPSMILGPNGQTSFILPMNQ